MDKEYLELGLSSDDWCIHRNQYNREEDGFYESLFALTNGRFGVRATVNFESRQGSPGIFISDLYGPAIAVRSELVNALHFGFWSLTIDGRPLNIADSRIIAFRQTLDLYKAAVITEFTLADFRERITKVNLYNFLPASESNVMITIFDLEAVNHLSKIEIHSGIDWSFGNGYMGGTEPNLRLHHLDIKETRCNEGDLTVGALNRGTEKYVAATVSHLTDDDSQSFLNLRQKLLKIISFIPGKRRTASFIRIATFEIGNDLPKAIADAERQAKKMKKTGVRSLMTAHRDIWKDRWKKSAVSLSAPTRDVQALNFGIFHLLQAPDRQAQVTNIAARGLTSEYHSGHFFFNTELYLVPYYAATEPAIARSLIMHRTQTIEAAIKHAAATGYEGARYPEEADIEGYPAAPKTIFNPFTGEVIEEFSGIEVMHLSADVLYGLSQYLEITGDEEFFFSASVLKMVVEIARYNAGLMKFDSGIKARGARSVMCFDEFHYHVNHHFATNFLARWVLRWTIDKLETIAGQLEKDESLKWEQTLEKLNAGKEKRNEWRKIADEIFLPLPDENEVLPQFDGYFLLPVQTVRHNESQSLPVIDDDIKQRMDSLSPFETQLIKQADIVLLISMFPQFFQKSSTEANLEFYDARTLHASSLSMTPHAHVAASLGKSKTAYKYMMAAMRYNLDFQPKTNYLNGIHLAGYAGAWNALVRGFLGFQIQPRGISFTPKLPPDWKKLKLCLTWHGNRLEIILSTNELKIRKLSGADETFMIEVGQIGKKISNDNSILSFSY